MNEIENAIKTGEYKRVYLLFGEEKYMIREYTQKLRDAVCDKATEMLNLSIFEGRAEIDGIIKACDTLPFMSEKRLVIVKDSKLFEQGRKDDSEKMKDYIPSLPESTILLFAEEKADKRSALYKAVNKNGVCCELGFLKDSELIKWVIAKSEKRIKGAQAEYLIRNVGTSMEALEGEIDKLLSYSSDGAEITNAVIDEICTKSPETNIFEMVEAIGRKQSAKALEIYHNMLRMKQSPVGVLKIMARQFKLILECKYLQGKGMGAAAIAEELSLRRFIADRCLQQANNFKIPTLVKALEDCAKCDTDFKSGKITDKLGVEVIILKYSR